MQLREVMVFDTSGNNVALSKTATQVNTSSNYAASFAVDGDTEDTSSATMETQGVNKYHNQKYIFDYTFHTFICLIRI